MRLKNRSLSILLCAVFLFILTTPVLAAPVLNWGDLAGETDVIPLMRENDILNGDSYFSPVSGQAELEFTVDGYSRYFKAAPLNTRMDVMIIRTTSPNGDLGGTAWYTGDEPIDLIFEENGTSGQLGASFDVPFASGLWDGESCDASFQWDFSQKQDKLMTGVLHAPRYGSPILTGDTASCDVGVVLLEGTPTFDIFVGRSGEDMQYARSLGPVTSTDCNIDAGLVFLRPDDSLGIIFANLWDEQVQLSTFETGFSIMRNLFAPELYASDGPPAMIRVNDYHIIDPALAVEGYLASIGTQEESFTDINFVDGTTTRISWLWCIPLVEEGPTAVGLIAYQPTSADVNDVLDPDVAKVLDPEDFGRVSSSFTLVGDAEPGEYIGVISMDIDIPQNFEGEVLALPIGLRIGIDPGELEEYDPELVDTIEAEIGDDPSEEEMEAALRKYYSFVKEWTTGETFQIRLDDEDFRDAVDIFFEYDGDGVVDTILFTVNLLIVDGGNAGEVDSVTVDGRTYIVIYDGNNDEKFADPIKLVAATEDSGGNGGGGCSALGSVPAAGLLLLPLFLLFRK